MVRVNAIFIEIGSILKFTELYFKRWCYTSRYVLIWYTTFRLLCVLNVGIFSLGLLLFEYDTDGNLYSSAREFPRSSVYLGHNNRIHEPLLFPIMK